MTMPIIDTVTATTAAADSPLRTSVLAEGWSNAACACMAARIIGTGRPVVQLCFRPARDASGGSWLLHLNAQHEKESKDGPDAGTNDKPVVA